jgi:dCMP deaminase
LKNLVDKIYTLKNNFILVGLTGKTGSGCSTVAEILKNGYIDYKAVDEKDKYIQQKKDRIIKNFASKNFKDKAFYIIKPSTIIIMIFVFEKIIFFNEVKKLKHILNQYEANQNIEEIRNKCLDVLELYKLLKIFWSFNIEEDKRFEKLLLNISDKNIDLLKDLIDKKREKYESKFKEEKFDDLIRKLKHLLKIKSNIKIDFDENRYKAYKNLTNEELLQKFQLSIDITNLFLEKMAKNHYSEFINWYEEYDNRIKELRDNKEIDIKTLQKIGDLVRSNIDIFRIPDYVNLVIKALRAKSKANSEYCYIVIDSLKNPFEIVYFKEKYSAYYTFSIHAKDETIYSRFENIEEIKEIHKREIFKPDSEKQKDSLDSKEDFNSQNVIECIQRSDIYIDNNKDKKDSLYKQIFKYLSLIVHPGLVTPSKDETIMQLALNAKYNSGCISRQVGAVVLNKHDSVKSIGWNEVPEGQVPCNLRSHGELLNNSQLLDYSQYERQKVRSHNAFKYIFTHKPTQKEQYNTSNKYGLPDSFCFKQVQNNIDKNKNQVYTRSLHAEENAFLQLAKYGNTEIVDGQLFTTASPCFLCAKKAYQLGIRRVVYIEAYPDISNEQIFACGFKETEIVHFRGAIGLAYQKLYEPMFSYKDELKAINM